MAGTYTIRWYLILWISPIGCILITVKLPCPPSDRVLDAMALEHLFGV